MMNQPRGNRVPLRARSVWDLCSIPPLLPAMTSVASEKVITGTLWQAMTLPITVQKIYQMNQTRPLKTMRSKPKSYIIGINYDHSVSTPLIDYPFLSYARYIRMQSACMDDETGYVHMHQSLQPPSVEVPQSKPLPTIVSCDKCIHTHT